MTNDFTIPQDTLRFINTLGKDPADTRIRIIANQNSLFRGAIKERFHPIVLQRWQRLKGGIYIVVNDGGDSDESISVCRALFIEHDDIPLDVQASCWKGILPDPTLQVYTGGKSYQQYWVFSEPINVDRWLALTLKAIKALDSDPSVKNPSRVMRLPGFTYYNRKGESGPPASIISCLDKTYSAEELELALAHVDISIRSTNPCLTKHSSNHDWTAARPCPICGRDLDDKCRLHADETFIQCHLGDTYMPPDGKVGAAIRGHDGQLWKRKGRVSNVYGDAVGFSLVQEEPIGRKIKQKSELISFISEEYGTRLGFNDLKRRLELDGQPIKDLNLMHCELAAEYEIQHNAATVSDAFLFVGKKSSYNPVQRLLLSSEQYEPACDLADIGARYLKLTRPIESRVFGMHLLAAVYRAFHPGYQYDQILIMRGKQGVGKTRTIKALAGSPEHYISTSVLTNEKDFLIQLGSCWHCEFEEIDGHIDSKHEAQLKALISRHTDNYRAPYAASVEDQPRRCVFWGTTNQDKLLVDSTGNRRMMIIDLLHEIDHDLIHKDIMRIWSAVMKAYRFGQKPVLSQEEIRLVAQIANESFKEDPWLGIIEARIDGTPVVFEHTILKSILGMEVRNIKGGRSGDQRRVRDCLTQLGYQRYPNQINGLNNHNKGYANRTRGAWFAPDVEPSSNGQIIVDLLKAAGKFLPVGPGFEKDIDPFVHGSDAPF
jgi:hypothetical protein